MNWSIASILVSLSAFGVAYYLYTWVKAQPSSNKEIARIGDYIRRGANAFLTREYKLLAVLVLVVAALIFLTLPNPIWQEEASVKTNLFTALSYIAGSIFSALAGKIGIFVATLANVKSAEAATKGIRPAFMAGFRGGAVMGMAVVGSSLLGVTVVMLLTQDPTLTLGFSFGASSLALFAKAGGGILPKLQISALTLLVKLNWEFRGRSRNPAVIADNVGDNVGDVAGMGADLFDSHVASLSAALVLGMALDGGTMVPIPIWYCAMELLVY